MYKKNAKHVSYSIGIYYSVFKAKYGNADAFKEFFDIGYEKVLTGVWQPLPTYSHGANGSAGSIPARPVF